MSYIRIENIIDIDINSQQVSNNIKEYSGYVKFNDIKDQLRYSSRRINKIDDDHNATLYQRPSEKKRVKEIKEFLKKHYELSDKTKILPFPTPVTLSINSEIIIDNTILINNDNKLDIENYFNTTNEQSIIYNNILYINTNIEKSIFIVDGQHRISAMEDFIHEYKDKELYIFFTLLINYDLSMQAKVFANINFKVKPVNKSLYYDIFGSIPNEYNELTFSHMIVTRINQDETIGKLIRMLGNGSGTISLAFMVENIIDSLIKTNSKQNNNTASLNNIYQVYTNNQKEFKNRFSKLGILFVDYLKYIKEIFSSTFPIQEDNGEYKSYSYKSILTKTTGMYSLIKLLNEFDIENIVETKYNNEKIVKEYSREEFYKLLDNKFSKLRNKEQKLFGENSKFSKAGSNSLQKDLYKKIICIIDKERCSKEINTIYL
jgi:DGQHR domain-containing protein